MRLTRPSADALQVGGLVPLSTMDFPGELAAVVFVRGCPLRCGYCHNPHLQSRAPAPEDLRWPVVRDWLASRRGLLDAVVFSGGEPTVDPALPAAIDDARSLGLRIGLHTAGVYPARVRALVGRLDWVGLDVKAPLTSCDAYRRIVGVPASPSAVERTLAALLAHGVAVECRTTTHPSIHTETDLLAIADGLATAGVRHFALQRARASRDGPASAGIGAAPAGWPSTGTLAGLHARFERFTCRSD